LQAAAALWLTVRVWPATVSVPLRGDVTELAATSYDTMPLPVPLLPPLSVIQVALLVAVHVQPLAVVTAVEEELPAAAALCEVGEIE
jgi:hypothetical protein